ncbi:MAG: methylmalonyl-CoA epimerase [Acidimicrobiia bacterium]|nr:methylmalonyl-CoA epimerase [Acidimicrobiia bacterium]
MAHGSWLIAPKRYAAVVLPYNIHHVAIAVSDLDDALDGFRDQYGFEVLHREIVDDQGVEEALIAVGGSHVQLLAPLYDTSPVGKFLERRGEGMHHVAFAVADIQAALEHLRRAGARLIDETPRIGGGGHRIAFVHPGALAGTLIELVEVDTDA